MARPQGLVMFTFNAKRHDALQRRADHQIAFAREFVAARWRRPVAILRTKFGQNTCPVHPCPCTSRFIIQRSQFQAAWEESQANLPKCFFSAARRFATAS